MNIEELTLEEERLMAKINRVEGQIEEKIRLLEAYGVFRTYKQVHESYAELALQKNLEALKRAFFLQWYAAIEPAFLTGIPDGSPLGTQETLNNVTQLAVLKELEGQLVTGKLDDELRWMLAYAYSVVDYYFEYYFERQEDLCALKQYLSTINTHIPWIDISARKSLEGRGQMGDYFIDIINYIKSQGAV